MASYFRCALERHARQQAFCAFVRIAKPLFEPHDRFTVGSKTEMAWLDDAGVDRANGNLMQAFALYRKEGVSKGMLPGPFFSERAMYVPFAVIEPRSRI